MHTFASPSRSRGRDCTACSCRWNAKLTAARVCTAQTAMKEKISVVEEKMGKLTERLSSIKEQLDKNDSSRPDANSDLGKAKAAFNNAKSESRRLQQEKRNIYDQISAADELRQQQQDLVTRLRGELQVFSVDEIERKIKQLEYKQSTTSLTVKEDKAIMEEIKKLSAGKPKIQSFKEAQDSLTGIKEHHNTLYVSLKAKSSELTAAKEHEDKFKVTLDEVRAKEDAKKPDMPKLFKERDELRKQVTEHRDAIRKIQAEFNEERKAWFAFQKVGAPPRPPAPARRRRRLLRPAPVVADACAA